jgi:plasmid maintenance system antidote protein VapI
MTIQEAADRLHVHPTSLSKLVKEDALIHGAKIAGKWDIHQHAPRAGAR